MKASNFDDKFDSGEEDIIDLLDLSKARRPGLEEKKPQDVKKRHETSLSSNPPQRPRRGR